jgi:5,10-methylenetetrahydromethanopterin reductase
MPVPLRNPALAAMEIATLARLFPGRFVPAFGHGVQDWMGQVGARAASPMGLLREYAIALRRLLDGEKVSVAGRYVNLDDVALDWPPLRRPALMIGAKGVKSLALAGELGDGALLHGELTDAAVQSACAVVQEAAAGPGPDIFGLQLVATGPEAAARLEAELTRSGQPTDLGIGVAGDAPAIAASLRRWAGFGVTSVTIQPTIDEPDLEAFINFLGREVRPLLS